mmetsp:Transcript_48603/g.110309  ORF Transcript_48603/g.110309 Transcript_48603/m.110309 type:complete len:343 (-) Transcript_48603:417-1445(-)
MVHGTPAQLTREKHMAMRWSSYVSKATPEGRRGSPVFGSFLGGCTTRASRDSSTSTPRRPSSVTMATIRSVSLSRQVYTLRIAIGPSAKRATTARVIAASGMPPQSTSTPLSVVPSGRETVIEFGPHSTVAPICSRTFAKATSPCTDSEPHPTTVTGPPVMAPAAKKYDADDASPSTKTVPGLLYPWPAAMVNFSSFSLTASTPNFFIKPIVRCTYGADTSSSVICTSMSPSARGAAMSRALKNCDEICPLILATPPVHAPALMSTGGHPVSLHETWEPSWVRPSTRSAMGRSRIRSTPSRTYSPSPKHRAAARGRIAVPALPRKSSSFPEILKGPPMPVTV